MSVEPEFRPIAEFLSGLRSRSKTDQDADGTTRGLPSAATRPPAQSGRGGAGWCCRASTPARRSAPSIVTAPGRKDWIYGTPLADTLNGGDKDDIICGGADADTIIGGTGNDELHGNENADTIYDDELGSGNGKPGDGNDKLFGDNGSDTLYGNGGNDILRGDNNPVGRRRRWRRRGWRGWHRHLHDAGGLTCRTNQRHSPQLPGTGSVTAGLAASGRPVTSIGTRSIDSGGALSSRSVAVGRGTVWARWSGFMTRWGFSVPVEFLTDAQAATYGCSARPPSVAELDRCFLLDDKARGLIESKRLPHTRLGFAVQLTTLLFIGRFLNGLALSPPAPFLPAERSAGHPS